MSAAIDIVVFYDDARLFATTARRATNTRLVLPGEGRGLLENMVVGVQFAATSGSGEDALSATPRLPARVTRVSRQSVWLELECHTAHLPWCSTLDLMRR